MEYKRPMIERTADVASPVVGGAGIIGSGLQVSPTWRPAAGSPTTTAAAPTTTAAPPTDVGAAP